MGWWQAALLASIFALTPGPALSLIALVLGRLGGHGLQQAEALASHEPLVFALASLLSVVPPLWLARQPLPRAPVLRAFALRRVSWPVIVIATFTGVALQLPLSEVANLVELIAPVSLDRKVAIAALLSADTPPQTLKLLLAVVVTAPVCEELLFRGVLLRGMERAHGPTIALGLSATYFGVAHAGLITAVLPAALAGLALGWLTLRTGSIVPSIAMHAAVNAVPVLLSRSRVEITGFNTVQAGVYHVPLLWLVPSCVVALAGLWWLNRSTRNEFAAS
jgi:membrane protease YdiL (CAAX protease family)